jgi:hypothetical protein
MAADGASERTAQCTDVRHQTEPTTAGADRTNPSSIALDGAGNIDLVGSTSSLDFPDHEGVMQPSAIVPPWNSFAPAGFVARFGPDGFSLNWASYVMSFERLPAYANVDIGVSALAVSPAGDI